MHTKLLTSPLLLSSLTYGAYLPPRAAAGELHMVGYKAKAFRAPTINQVTEHYLPLKRGSSTSSRSAGYLGELIAQRQTSGLKSRLPVTARGGGSSSNSNLGPVVVTTRDVEPAPLASAMQGQEFLIDLTFGGEKATVILDTGSSDTWLIKKGFSCTDPSRNRVPEQSCKFGPTFNGSYQGPKNQNQYFSVRYGDGEFVTGDLGHVDVGVGGVTVKKQTIALGNSAYWAGDGVSSGLVGLAYESLTSAYSGTDPSRGGAAVPYDPLFTSMMKQNLSAPMFSIALQRGNKGGYIAFGGLPPVDFDKNFATTPILMQSVRRNGQASNSSVYSFYAIKPDALEYQGSSSTQNNVYIVDSGTSLTLLPSAEARAINALFSPPAELDPSSGLYIVGCDAKGPDVAFKIGGTSFKINPTDLISTSLGPGSSQCITGVQDGGGTGGIYILGDTFMQSVVSVFDVGAAQMRFAVHNY